MLINLGASVVYHCRRQDRVRSFTLRGTTYTCDGCGWELHPLTIAIQLSTDDYAQPYDIMFPPGLVLGADVDAETDGREG